MAFVIDIFARRIVGWRVSRTATAGLVLDALEQAIHQRRPAQNQLMHHSDRGSQRRKSPCLSAASGTPMTVNVVVQLDGLTHATIDFVSLR